MQERGDQVGPGVGLVGDEGGGDLGRVGVGGAVVDDVALTPAAGVGEGVLDE
ncbi:hypothetical protein J2S43_001052 [Catenuloplanes nepalensis]|uniref:Uncharacterized protein n=1 Tax=Catenuloplanes nepalensis TaxID=587533 RepID=A0ABT9MM86_9ACTN|nr:hypothetical protein [Catenuloplanes nepalensis]